MKKIILSLAFTLLFLGCRKEEKPASGGAPQAALPAQPPVAGDLVITAELAEIRGEFPANDLYNYVYIMKYKVKKVVQGEYPGTEILIGHYNPRIARSEIADDQKKNLGGNLKVFNVGETHYLVLNNLDKVWTGAVEDDYYKDKSPRYWASWVDRL